jgi:hypothetical protein
MNSNLLLLPMAIHALVTMFLYLPMSRARVRSVVEGKVKASVYKYLRDEPEESLKFSNAIRNQNESGILYYAACLVAVTSGAVSPLTIGLAWAFAIAKIVHVAIQTTTNQLRYRRPMFSVALLILVAFWIVLLLHLAGAI